MPANRALSWFATAGNCKANQRELGRFTLLAGGLTTLLDSSTNLCAPAQMGMNHVGHRPRHGCLIAPLSYECDWGCSPMPKTGHRLAFILSDIGEQTLY